MLDYEVAMTYINWSASLDTTIETIDRQHRHIVNYINQLHHARISGHAREDVGKVIDGLIDYTSSHFALEESMMQEARYPFCASHKKLHELFIKRVDGFRARFVVGEDIAEELNHLLEKWLYHHIALDADYVAVVKQNIHHPDVFMANKKGFFGRLFG